LVQRENLERLDDDIAILSKYLKTEESPRVLFAAIKALQSSQHESWDELMVRVNELLE
jgi:hypothetical protein